MKTTKTMETTKTKKTKKTKRYKYSYCGRHIFQDLFEEAVPKNWEAEVINGTYFWNGYKAVEISQDEE